MSSRDRDPDDRVPNDRDPNDMDDMDDDTVTEALRAEIADVAPATSRARRVIVDDSGDGPVDESDDESGDVSGGHSAGDTTAIRAQKAAEKAELRAVRREQRREGRAQRREERAEQRELKKSQKSSQDPSTAISGGSKASSSKLTVERDGKKRVVISDDSVAEERPRQKSVVGESRFRQRRIDINRSEGRRRFRLVVVAGIAVLVVVVVLLLLTSPILSVRTVNVEGNAYADPEVVASVVDDLMGEPILTADLHRAEVVLRAVPWVEDARVTMRLPSTVTIEIVERRPEAYYRGVDGFNRVLDHEGRVLDVIEGDPVDYPLIAGTGPSISAGQTVDQPFLGAVQLIDSLTVDLRTRLESAAVTPEGDVSLVLSDGVTVLFGRPDDFQTKLVGVINEIKRQGSSPYSVIDVSSGDPSVR